MFFGERGTFLTSKLFRLRVGLGRGSKACEREVRTASCGGLREETNWPCLPIKGTYVTCQTMFTCVGIGNA